MSREVRSVFTWFEVAKVKPKIERLLHKFEEPAEQKERGDGCDQPRREKVNLGNKLMMNNSYDYYVIL